MNADGLAKAIDKLVYEWQLNGLVLDSNTSKVTSLSGGRSLVSWPSNGNVLKDNDFSSFGEYLNLLRQSQYTMVLFDGSLIQISYTLKRGGVVGHRLCWYPCPIPMPEMENLDVEEFFQEIYTIFLKAFGEIEGWVTSSIDNKPEKILLEGVLSKSPIRIDFMEMPDDKKDEHPDVHLHICEENCRIPVKTPLCIRQFMMFVAENFYPELYIKSYLFENLMSWDRTDKLTNYHKRKLHFNIIN